jgi:hypothetical protein
VAKDLADTLQNLAGLGNDLWANAIAGQNSNPCTHIRSTPVL